MKKGKIITTLIWASTAIFFGCGQQKANPNATESIAISESVNESTTTEDSITNTKENIEVDSTAILNPQVAQEIEQFISATYTEVFSAYAQANKGGSTPDRSVFDKKYLTERFQAEIDNEEMIDCDYWIQAQDFSTPTFEIKGIHVTDNNNGYADIIIKVFGEETTTPTLCRVIVQKANGNWKIDNFKSSEN
jgi:hypothetical protein